MTQEEKDLLLKDLIARLPYGGVKIKYCGNEKILLDSNFEDLFMKYCSGVLDTIPVIEEVKPYLFPLSSMTEEQKIELNRLSKEECDIVEYIVNNPNSKNVGFPVVTYYMVDWCNKNHFDYRGLIPKGLAIDATGLNIY